MTFGACHVSAIPLQNPRTLHIALCQRWHPIIGDRHGSCDLSTLIDGTLDIADTGRECARSMWDAPRMGEETHGSTRI